MNRSGHQSRRGFLLTSTAVGIAAATGGCHVRGAEDQKKDVLLHGDDRTDAPLLMQGFPPPKERRVTLPDYREDQAHRRWSHMHMRELFPTQLLWREAFYYKESDARGLLWASERATGQRFSDLFSSMIWSKLGAERDAYVCCDGLGSRSTNGRITCTLRDLARWGLMHLNGGKFNGNRILPQDFIDDIPSDADPAKITEDSFPGPRQSFVEKRP